MQYNPCNTLVDQIDNILPGLITCNTRLINHITDNHTSVICKSRQGGITTSLLGYMVWFTSAHTKSTISYVTINSQIRTSLLKLREFLEYNNIPTSSITKQSITLSNGSTIHISSTGTVNQSIRPYDLIIVDELVHIKNNDLVMSCIYRCIQKYNSKVVVCSAVSTIHDMFYDMWISANDGIDPTSGIYIQPSNNSIWKPLLITYHETPHLLNHPMVKSLPNFKSQYLCIFDSI